MVALGNISSIEGLDMKCTSLRQRILEIGLIGFSWEHQKILLNQPIKFSVYYFFFYYVRFVLTCAVGDLRVVVSVSVCVVVSVGFGSLN